VAPIPLRLRRSAPRGESEVLRLHMPQLGPGFCRIGLLAESQSLMGLRHEAGLGQTLRPLQSRRASAVPLLAAPLRLQPRHRWQAAAGLRPLHRQLEQGSPKFSGRHNPGSHPPYSRRRRRALLPTGTCRSLRDSLRFSALSPELPELRSLSTRRPDSLAHQPGPRRSPATAGLRRVRDHCPRPASQVRASRGSLRQSNEASTNGEVLRPLSRGTPEDSPLHPRLFIPLGRGSLRRSGAVCSFGGSGTARNGVESRRDVAA